LVLGCGGGSFEKENKKVLGESNSQLGKRHTAHKGRERK
jgi:hypothetical protein